MNIYKTFYYLYKCVLFQKFNLIPMFTSLMEYQDYKMQTLKLFMLNNTYVDF